MRLEEQLIKVIHVGICHTILDIYSKYLQTTSCQMAVLFNMKTISHIIRVIIFLITFLEEVVALLIIC